tara:strand:- start:877 stop:1104 length:228 start_codon:yes stop_codon:yes gene_type:complete
MAGGGETHLRSNGYAPGFVLPQVKNQAHKFIGNLVVGETLHLLVFVGLAAFHDRIKERGREIWKSSKMLYEDEYG